MSVIKKTNAGYTVQLSIGSGKNRIRQNKTFATKREANEWLTQQSAILGGSKILLYQQKMTVMFFYDLWVANKKNGLAKNTQKSYLATRKCLSPYLSRIKISTLTHQQLQGIFNMLSKRYSHETLRKDLSHIRSMLRYAMRVSVVTAKINPADDVVITGRDDIYYKNVDDKVLPLSEFNIIKEYLIGFAVKRNDCHTRNMVGLSIAISTGLRGGEILALRYKDIDFFECTLTVSHSWDGKLVAPKTKSSRRVIPIPKWLVDKLKCWASLHELDLSSSVQVMTRSDGSVGNVVSLTSAFKNLQKKLGFPPQYSLHNLRHTIASHLLNKGVNMVTVSRLLGHSSIRITERYYLGLVSEDKIAERRKVLELL